MGGSRIHSRHNHADHDVDADDDGDDDVVWSLVCKNSGQGHPPGLAESGHRSLVALVAYGGQEVRGTVIPFLQY